MAVKSKSTNDYFGRPNQAAGPMQSRVYMYYGELLLGLLAL